MFHSKLFGSHGFRNLLIIGLASSLATPAISSGYMKISNNPDGTRTARISYADLDLSSSDGQRELNKRVKSAVSRICSEPGSLASAEHACRANASKSTQAQVFAAVERSQTRLAMATPGR
ncbi:hypothetical protein SCH01S_03_00680 [Sphingomonas changbaiensis NBRC 104936]|uniref:UrcA family protein n=1 Tax=Sphingomonas changbaiensis NBRC 104936 TaxID=1219043 RepID=A0A0E9MKQ8_9SPHN|nr:UrcA family protein [Sphingomonas changbaiensis]GAO38093.1 hypothetical protein SCH01S_03_00680 [Sphingomonas changbaiensis NBRC 104936]